jgi:hypothetical protein
MAFPRQDPGRRRRKLFLFPLMDMFFILLLFYLSVVVIGKEASDIQQSKYPTPLPDLGRTQVFIQMIDGQHFVWLDNTTIEQHRSIRRAVERNRGDLADLGSMMGRFVASMAECPTTEVNVVVRCPDVVSFGDLLIFQQTLLESAASRLPTGTAVLFAIAHGSVDDLLQAQQPQLEGDYQDIEVRF